MGSLPAIFQGFIFAIVNTGFLGMIGQYLKEDLNIQVFLLPRLLLFTFAVSVLLGTVFVSTFVPGSPFIPFWTVMFFLYFSIALTLLTYEMPLMFPILYACAYIYILAQAQTQTFNRFSPYYVLVWIVLASIPLTFRDEEVDQVAMKVASLFDFDESRLPHTYLFDKGGVFHVEYFAPAFVGLTTFGMGYISLRQYPPA